MSLLFTGKQNLEWLAKKRGKVIKEPLRHFEQKRRQFSQKTENDSRTNVSLRFIHAGFTDKIFRASNAFEVVEGFQLDQGLSFDSEPAENVPKNQNWLFSKIK